ncbi:MAG TPA: hypothetical protein VJT49_18405 [Amycolatopsis sp.]|uniref:hypothetical protein n=1 Tax=Amycolatopsis sp. TaxID=37632 RepID=UPI002B47F90F|nr:hypothetical protein [Amycolatopsis sp.]HKS47042.1 hypothetical protein [Amycolatopsis sp.]
MGYLFHPRRVDHGIDGHIDLVDPDSGVLLDGKLDTQASAVYSRKPAALQNIYGGTPARLAQIKDLVSGRAHVLHYNRTGDDRYGSSAVGGRACRPGPHHDDGARTVPPRQNKTPTAPVTARFDLARSASTMAAAAASCSSCLTT